MTLLSFFFSSSKEKKNHFYYVFFDLNYRKTCDSLGELPACSSRSHSFSSLPNFYSRFLLLTSTKIIKLIIASHLENQVNPMKEWFTKNGQQKNTKKIIFQKGLTVGYQLNICQCNSKNSSIFVLPTFENITQSRRFERIGNHSLCHDFK